MHSPFSAMSRRRPSVRRSISLGHALFVLLVSLAIAPSLLAQDLERRIRDALAAADLGRTRVGISAVDLRTGQHLAAVNDREPLIPASNQKLLTSAAALHVLRPQFSFRTRFLLAGDTLVIVGAGDPGLGDPELLKRLDPPATVDQFIDRLAQAIADSQPPAIASIVVDQRIFDAEHPVHPSWPADQLTEAYCAPVHGLNFHTNVVHVYAGPDSAGGVALRTEPSFPTVHLDSRVTLVRQGTDASRSRDVGIWMSRAPMTNRITVNGRINRALVEPVPVTIHDPGTQFAVALAHAMQRRGLLTLQPQAEPASLVRAAVADDPIDALIPSAREVLAVRTSLSTALARCNEDSANLYAEAIFKRLGREVTLEPGSWLNGSTAVRMILSERLDSDVLSGLIIADGSGMSRDNKVAPRTIASLLHDISKDPEVSAEFRASLAQPGSGTLKSRFQRNANPRNTVLAKTGYLNGVRSISGYVLDESTGSGVTFSLIMNDAAQAGGKAREFQERLVLVIDGWLSDTAGHSAAASDRALGG